MFEEQPLALPGSPQNSECPEFRNLSQKLPVPVAAPVQSVTNNFSDGRIQIQILFARDIFYEYKYE